MQKLHAIPAFMLVILAGCAYEGSARQTDTVTPVVTSPNTSSSGAGPASAAPQSPLPGTQTGPDASPPGSASAADRGPISSTVTATPGATTAQTPGGRSNSAPSTAVPPKSIPSAPKGSATVAGSKSAAPPNAPSPAPIEKAATLDLNSLEQRLRDTSAIGIFTKLSLKNQVDDLLAEFKAYHLRRSQVTLAQLRQQYEGLLLKVVSLLQDADPSLAQAISSSREAIWAFLTDPKQFAATQLRPQELPCLRA